MSDDSQFASADQSTALLESTDARFGTRSLLVAMTVVAILASIGNAMLNRYPADVRPRLIAFWGIWLAATIICMTYQFAQRKRAEEQAGRKLMQIPFGPSTSAWLAWHTVFTILFVPVSFWITSYLVADATAQTTSANWLVTWAFPLFFAMMTAAGIAPALWYHHVRFCETGILWDRKVLPWNLLIEYRWTGQEGRQLELFSADATNTKPWLKVSVASGRRAEVESLLESMKKRSALVTGGSPRVRIGQVSIPMVFRTAVMRRHLGAIAIGMICTAVLIYLGWIRQAGVREFDEALLAGLLVAGFLSSLKLSLTKGNAGTPLARVFGRQDWLGFLTTFAAAIGLYLVVTHFTCPVAWPVYAAGVAYCYLTARTAAYFFWTQLDLREHGVVMPGALYWRWPTVNVVQWNRASDGRLVLGRRWRRVVATVPAGQRDAVNRILVENVVP